MALRENIVRNIKERTFRRGLTNLFNRIYREFKYANFHHFLNSNRLLIKKYERKIKCVTADFVPYANYLLDRRLKLDRDSVVYSFGILNDVSFELELVQKNNCTVHLFDPTPVTIEFMKQFSDLANFIYKPIGLWNEDKTLTFYLPKQGGSASAIIDRQSMNEFKAPCYKLSSIMRSLGHTKIDLLKMDIEGAALPAMQQFFSEDIYPTQIVAEFENPGVNKEQTIAFLESLDKLNAHAERVGYEIHQIPRLTQKYYAIELVYSRINTK